MSNLTCPHSDILTDALNVAELAEKHGLELVLVVVHFAKVQARCLAPHAVAQDIDIRRTFIDDNGYDMRDSIIVGAIGYRNLDQGDWAERGV